ncbi:hypothetical protein OEZ49_22740 [Ruegeria sp. WL0004]|uniref:HNH nuclease domain-containing protein n=1 Tax=Ruegeria marisflavi TaxID=2984152 RepID=A0ABT2X3B8_9RHOB|nr:hypothetical protein [Ruegeria sp. WL0004]MCU9840568.1 hypothetical protein [Ruegeria sp. WL0004]
MKLETLAKRIAKKSRTPALEKIVLGQGTVQDLPDTCIIWHGAASGKNGHRQRMRRGYDNMPYTGISFDHRRPVINFQKKTYQIPRLLFEKLHDKPFPFRFHQLCATEMCINPLHFEPRKVNLFGYEPFRDFEAPPEEPIYSEEWGQEDVKEIVEIALTESTPLNWSELMSLPIMEGAPEKQVAAYLQSIGKPHLTPVA